LGWVAEAAAGPHGSSRRGPDHVRGRVKERGCATYVAGKRGIATGFCRRSRQPGAGPARAGRARCGRVRSTGAANCVRDDGRAERRGLAACRSLAEALGISRQAVRPWSRPGRIARSGVPCEPPAAFPPGRVASAAGLRPHMTITRSTTRCARRRTGPRPTRAASSPRCWRTTGSLPKARHGGRGQGAEGYSRSHDEASPRVGRVRTGGKT